MNLWKEVDMAFMSFYTKKYSNNLRPPDFKEAQEADQQIWGDIFDLTNDKDVKLNDAIYEVLHIRHSIRNYMQPRPSTDNAKGRGKGKAGKGDTSRQTQQKGTTQTTKGDKKKGTGKGQKGKKGSQFIPPDNWATTVKGKEPCHRHHADEKGCTYGRECKFSHECPVLVDGRACGKWHKARFCPHNKVPPS